MFFNFAFFAGFVCVVIAYLLGSIPFAVLVSRAMRLPDPRQFGSKNPGATNVLRAGNKWAAGLTLFGDAAKGWLAVYLSVLSVRHFGTSETIIAWSALAVFLGHLFPIFAGFKGGKGVATAFGVLFAIQPGLGLATAATWLIVAYASRYSSLAAILAAVFAPLYYLFGGDLAWPLQPSIALSLVAISVLLCFRHQANIARLLKGKEPRIGQKRTR